MKKLILYTSILGMVASVAQAQSQNVTWQAPVAISGASDVNTQGTFFGSWAPEDTSANTLPVNGVVFQGYSSFPEFNVSGFNSGYNSYNNPGTANANYNALLQYAAYDGSGNGGDTVTWSDTLGHTYLIQIWANDGRGNGRSETFTGGANTSASVVFGNAPGQYIIGTYVADSSGTETITLSGAASANGDYPQINLLQVRDITVTPVTNYQSAVLADNPLAYYSLNPASDPSGDSPDLTGNGNDGSSFNISAAAGPSSYITNAASFDGMSSFDDISQANNPGLLDFSGPITLEAWVQPSSASLSAGLGDIVAKGYNGYYNEIVLRVNGSGNGLDYFGSSGSEAVSGGAQTTNWAYVVLSSDGIHTSLYVNGGLVQQTSDVNGAITFSDDWVIGDGSDGGYQRYFSGNISQVAIYNHGLTAAQIQAHYNLGLYGTTNPPPPLAGPSLKWSPNNNDGVWDTDTSTNWINVTNGQPTVFNANDPVLFDDTPGVPTSVTVSGTVSPNMITVNSSTNNFSIASGAFSGSASLIKEGSSILTIDTGGLNGPVTISGGAISAGNQSLDIVSSITITNNSTLDLAGSTLSGTPIIVSGTGLNGEGAIYNTYSDDPGELLNITLVGDTKFGEAARWDLASGSQISGAHNLTVDMSADTNDNSFTQWNTTSIGANLLGIFVTNGTALGMSYMDASCLNPATLFTVSSGSQMIFYSGGFNGSIHILGGGLVSIPNPNVAFNGRNLILESNSLLETYYNAGVNNINSAVTLNGVAHFVLGDHSMVYTNLISGSGGFVLNYYNDEMVLSASNTYSGPTIIGSSGNTPEVALTGNGSISKSSLIFFGGSDPTVAHIDVSERTDQTFTLTSGQTLAGIGGINGNLAVLPGATISPSGTNTTIGITTGANSTGVIGVADSVTLQGTTVLKLDGSGVNDSIQSSGGSITYGGALQLVNISGSPLAAGNSFQLFSGTSYTGSFPGITPATPGPGLAWDTSQLDTLGFLNVVAVSAGPTISSTSNSNGELVFSGTGGTASGSYYVLTTTNLATTNWVIIATNSFGANGSFAVTNAINSNTPQMFYKIESAP